MKTTTASVVTFTIARTRDRNANVARRAFFTLYFSNSRLNAAGKWKLGSVGESSCTIAAETTRPLGRVSPNGFAAPVRFVGASNSSGAIVAS